MKPFLAAAAAIAVSFGVMALSHAPAPARRSTRAAARGPSAAQLRFPPGAPFDADVSRAPLDSESARIIAALERAGGWGGGAMRIDFGLEVLAAGPEAAGREFTPTDDWFAGHCDRAAVPLPATGAVEGMAGYTCEGYESGDPDCHLLVLHLPARRLYEMWRADVRGSAFRGGCLAVWDLTAPWRADGRGEGCASADAAGLPIAPLLFSTDEVAAGSIDHALRFVLPNDRIRRAVYVRPATHATRAARGGPEAPPYGARFRLRADYPVSTLPSEGARVVARALQRHGMILADGGNITLTARSDRSTSARWDGLLGPRDLSGLRVTDFEVVDGGERHRFDDDCRRHDR